MRADVRELVVSRAGAICEYCRLPQHASVVAFHVEHVLTRKHGGSDEPENLALACDRCNLAKGPNLSGIDPVSGVVVDLFHPRRQPWATHFVITQGTVAGLTDIGRATVATLNMNAPRRVQLRAAAEARPPEQ
jgi:hypothetical protein